MFETPFVVDFIFEKPIYTEKVRVISLEQFKRKTDGKYSITTVRVEK